ncbi:tyrosine-protein phosphatase 99A [Trichonephila clavipes]|nr:tyrosine-protein phosphatase 99A [Trichonephila clavipes]
MILMVREIKGSCMYLRVFNNDKIKVGESGEWDESSGIMTTGNGTSWQVIGLQPYTVYSFRVVAVNTIGASRPSKESYYMVTLREGENASQVAEIVNGVYGVDTVTANYVQFWFRPFRSGIFDVKDAPRTGRAIVENVDKITEIIEVDRMLVVVVSSRS